VVYEEFEKKLKEIESDLTQKKRKSVGNLKEKLRRWDIIK
ncbi:hypothetical protein SNEBB_010745, partial [Seison nebaliae]